MGDFKLKAGIDVKYDALTHLYTFGNIDTTRHKKVTSTVFPRLIGANDYESIGKSILERFNAIEKEEIDPYYSVRGDIGELLALDYLKKKYDGIVLKTWDKSEVAYDNFPFNDRFGGLIDIAIVKPTEMRAVVEVKSKSLKDYQKIEKGRGNKDEIKQGVFLAKMSNVDKCIMLYVFFSTFQEDKIKRIMQKYANPGIGFNVDSRFVAREVINEGLGDVEITEYEHTYMPQHIDLQMKESYKRLLDFAQTKSIQETSFSGRERDYLKALTGQQVNVF